MIRPCPDKVDCEGSDFPLRNLSSEGPDLPQYSATGFCCNGAQAWAFSLVSQENADDALFRLLKTSCPECAEARQYCAEAKCPDGTVLAKYCSPISQEVVDEWAAQREALMLPFCDDTGQLFSATCACPDGSNPVTMYSPFSVDDALAACESVPKDCSQICNDEQSCTVACPDGTTFTYVQPPCTIYGATVAEANALALALACERAAALRICLGTIDPCTCMGEGYSATIAATGTTTNNVQWDIVLGSLPPGLTLTHVVGTPNGLISGVPSTYGHFQFTVRATLPTGSYALKTFDIYVLVITTSSLPSFTVGTAYSYQLQAAGGTGNYAWRLATGTLPDGLTLSLTGLISGTPTAAGSGALVFEVIDLSCESLHRGFYTPHAKLFTTATTVLKIKRGYPTYFGINNPLYKKITWTGSITQRAYALGNLVGGVQYVWNGSTQIDASGNFITHHTKNQYVMCNREIYPAVGGLIAELQGLARVTRLVGYCWSADPISCPFCPTNEEDWTFRGNFQTGSPTDPPEQVLLKAANKTYTPLSYHYSGNESESILGIEGVNQFPGVVVLNGIVVSEPPVDFQSSGDFQAVLSEPYTDADAEATKQTFTSQLATAENKPDYLRAAGQQFLTLLYSRETSVNFTIKCSNLLAGQTYLIRYELWDSDGTKTIQLDNFSATSTTHDYTGTVPTPATGHSITIKNVSIRYL